MKKKYLLFNAMILLFSIMPYTKSMDWEDWELEEEGEVMDLEKTITLVSAAADGDVDMVRFFIEQGADVNTAEGEYKQTALHQAIESGHRDVFDYLIDVHGIDINKPDQAGITPLIVAADNERIDMVRELITRGADVNATSDAGTSPLFMTNSAETARVLLENGAHVNHQDEEFGRTPLMWLAMYGGDTELFRLLLDYGADYNIVDEDGKTAMQLAVENENDEIIQAFIKWQAKHMRLP